MKKVIDGLRGIRRSHCLLLEYGAAPTADSKLPPFPRDIHSYAQPEEARVTNVTLDLTPDFNTKQIAGIARLAIQRSAGADSVILDVRSRDQKRH